MQQTLNRLWNEDVVLDPVSVCHTVETSLTQHVEAYVCYCRNASFQERTLRHLKKQQEFLMALSVLEHAPLAESLTLQSFLILPMQHITRLPLLVDAILHQLDAQPGSQTSQDYAAVNRCLETLHSITRQCNESARDMENRERLNEISKKIVFKKVKTVPLVTGNRYVVKTGTLTHIETRHSKLLWSPTMTDTKQLYLYVFTDLLLITKKKKEVYDVIIQSPLSRVCAVELSQSDVEKRFPRGTPSDCNNVFLVSFFKDKETIEYIFACKQSSEMTRWIAAFSPPATEDEDEKLYDERNDYPQVHTVKRFVASEPDELDLEEADVVSVCQKSPDGWLEGERIRDGKRGWFPSDHTMSVENQHVRRRNVCQQLRRKRSTASQKSFRRAQDARPQ